MLEIIFFWILVSVYSFVLIYETREQYILDIKDREAGENPGYFFWYLSRFYYFSGYRAIEKDNYKKAVLQFKRCLHFDTYSGEGYLGLGKAFLALGKVHSSQAMLEKAIRYAPGEPEVYFSMGVVLFKQSKFKDALSYFDKAYSFNEKDIDTLLYRGRCLFEIREIESSIESYLNALESVSGKLSFELFMKSFVDVFEGVIYKSMIGFFESFDIKYENVSYSDQFERSFEGIYCSDRKPEFTPVEKGAVLLMCLPAEECTALMQKFSSVFIKKIVEIISGLSELELVYKKETVKEFLEIIDWKQLIVVESHEARRYYHLGKSFLDRNNLELAISQFKKALKIEPHYVDARKDLGLSLARSGDLNSAIMEWERILSLGIRDGEVHKMLGDAYAKQGDLLLASREWKKASSLDPRSDEVRGE